MIALSAPTPKPATTRDQNRNCQFIAPADQVAQGAGGEGPHQVADHQRTAQHSGLAGAQAPQFHGRGQDERDQGRVHAVKGVAQAAHEQEPQVRFAERQALQPFQGVQIALRESGKQGIGAVGHGYLPLAMMFL
jgi:hypothetical protein